MEAIAGSCSAGVWISTNTDCRWTSNFSKESERTQAGEKHWKAQLLNAQKFRFEWIVIVKRGRPIVTSKWLVHRIKSRRKLNRKFLQLISWWLRVLQTSHYVSTFFDNRESPTSRTYYCAPHTDNRSLCISAHSSTFLHLSGLAFFTFLSIVFVFCCWWWKDFSRSLCMCLRANLLESLIHARKYFPQQQQSWIISPHEPMPFEGRKNNLKLFSDSLYVTFCTLRAVCGAMRVFYVYSISTSRLCCCRALSSSLHMRCHLT